MSEFPEIPGYRIDKLLGKGGMGVVYLAMQTSLDRQVALKVTLPSLAEMDESFTMRFVLEAKATAALNHPNIITIYDAGVFEQSSYMAMEYIPQGTLKDLSLENLTQEDVCHLFIGISRGLSAAHDAGFVHRDIKPDNIMIDEKGVPILTDFGIVKTLNQDTALTVLGSTIGTPQYMSPEQIRAKELDGRSDLYSLGVMLFNLLEGGVPFNDETPSAIYIMHVTAPPPPLSSGNKIFQPVVSRLLEKDPEARYDNAKELIIALKEIIRKNRNPTSAIKTKPVDIDRTKLNKPLDLSTKYPSQQDKVLVTTKDKILNNTPLMAGIAAVLLLTVSLLFYTLFNKKSESNEPEIVEKPTISDVNVITDNSEVNKEIDNESEPGKDETPVTNGVIEIVDQNQINTIDSQEKSEEVNLGLIDQEASQDKGNIQDSENADVINADNIVQDDSTKLPKVDETIDEKDATDLVIDKQNPLDNNIVTAIETNKTDEVIKPTTNEITENSDTNITKQSNNNEIEKLLDLAKKDIVKFKLLKPKGKNAYEKLYKILEIDDNNDQAKELVLQIAYKYLALSNSKAQSQKMSDAIKYINNAIQIKEDYNAKGYDPKEFYGVSNGIELSKLKQNKAALLKTQQQLQIAEEKRLEELRIQQEAQKQAQIRQAEDKLLATSDVESYKRGKESYNNGDYKAAFDWFMKSADKNYALAQDKLGSMYYKGKGVVKNEEIAVSWYLKAANQNLAIAQDHIGLMYFQGTGVKKSFKKAFKWFQKAAKQNNSNSQWVLGLLYENGRGVRKNAKKAKNWYKKAARQGNQQAIDRLKSL